MVNLILCGGSGTRLWPLSRSLMPKQFIKLFDNKSLFQLTVERNSKICDSQFIVSNAEQYFLALDQLEELNKANNIYLLEPVGRNTAPAIALACMALPKDEIVLVTPSDHLIKKEEEYQKVIKIAKKLASENNLVTFGIKPTFAETGFGYIETELQATNLEGLNVRKFHEKPSLDVAQKYIEENSLLNAQSLELKYYWNSGMFTFKAGVFLEELKKHSPAIYDASLQAFNNTAKDSLIRIKHTDMINIPEDSIDYAVMEKSSKVKVVPSDIDWSDVGSFDALCKELPHDSFGNTVSEHFIAVNSNNNMIMADGRLIATIDVDDLIIIDTSDALLVTKKGSSQHIKEIVARIKEKGLQLHHIHDTAYRPWGTYTILENEPNYKIKKIVVKPGKRLSLQKHFHRSEHWIVVSGTALVEIDGKEAIVRANESTFIPMGMLHRLSNPGKMNLILIEAQVGEYTGEDDIIRLEDDYARI